MISVMVDNKGGCLCAHLVMADTTKLQWSNADPPISQVWPHMGSLGPNQQLMSKSEVWPTWQ